MKPFDNYEIHGVAEFGKGRKRYCEQVPDGEAQFWSLYGHIPGEGLECIGDFKTRKHAEDVLARITGGAAAAMAAPELVDALEYFFNIMHDYPSSLRKGYVAEALRMAKEALAKAQGQAS